MPALGNSRIIPVLPNASREHRYHLARYICMVYVILVCCYTYQYHIDYNMLGVVRYVGPFPDECPSVPINPWDPRACSRDSATMKGTTMMSVYVHTIYTSIVNCLRG